MGFKSSATGVQSVAIGTQSAAMDASTISVGANSIAAYMGSVAIGAYSRAVADPTTAVGYSAVAMANNSVALGANSTALSTNSVALGQGSVADRANSVSVGYVGGERQITNVARGTFGTDAANLSQVNDALSQAKAYASIGVAQAMSIPTVRISPGDTNGVAVATANYAGYEAVGFSYAHVVSSHMQMELGFSAAGGGKIAAKAAGSFSW
ncbi:hypothetical protein C2U71_31790 [Burkholderia ubonensis]|nr:hypothetical protein C2U71_31790 [Burkholderia ubonensis]